MACLSDSHVYNNADQLVVKVDIICIILDVLLLVKVLLPLLDNHLFVFILSFFLAIGDLILFHLRILPIELDSLFLLLQNLFDAVFFEIKLVWKLDLVI